MLYLSIKDKEITSNLIESYHFAVALILSLSYKYHFDEFHHNLNNHQIKKEKIIPFHLQIYTNFLLILPPNKLNTLTIQVKLILLDENFEQSALT